MKRRYPNNEDYFMQQNAGGTPGQQAGGTSYAAFHMDDPSMIAARALQTAKAAMGLDGQSDFGMRGNQTGCGIGDHMGGMEGHPQMGRGMGVSSNYQSAQGMMNFPEQGYGEGYQYHQTSSGEYSQAGLSHTAFSNQQNITRGRQFDGGDQKGLSGGPPQQRPSLLGLPSQGRFPEHVQNRGPGYDGSKQQPDRGPAGQPRSNQPPNRSSQHQVSEQSQKREANQPQTELGSSDKPSAGGKQPLLTTPPQHTGSKGPQSSQTSGSSSNQLHTAQNMQPRTSAPNQSSLKETNQPEPSNTASSQPHSKGPNQSQKQDQSHTENLTKTADSIMVKKEPIAPPKEVNQSESKTANTGANRPAQPQAKGQQQLQQQLQGSPTQPTAASAAASGSSSLKKQGQSQQNPKPGPSGMGQSTQQQGAKTGESKPHQQPGHSASQGSKQPPAKVYGTHSDPDPSSQNPQTESEEEDDEDMSYCKLCNMAFDGPEQFFRHTRGLLHTQRQMAADEAAKAGTSQQNSGSVQQQASKAQKAQSNPPCRGHSSGGPARLGRGGLGASQGDGREKFGSGDSFTTGQRETHVATGASRGGSNTRGRGAGQKVVGSGRSSDSYAAGGSRSYAQDYEHDFIQDTYSYEHEEYGSEQHYKQSGDGYGHDGGYGQGDNSYEQGDYGYAYSTEDSFQSKSYVHGNEYAYEQEGMEDYEYELETGHEPQGGFEKGGGPRGRGRSHGRGAGYDGQERGGGQQSFGKGRGAGRGIGRGGRSSSGQVSTAAASSHGLAKIGGDYDDYDEGQEEDYEDFEEDYASKPESGQGELEDKSSQHSSTGAKLPFNQNEDYHCELCDVRTTGAVSFRAHLNGRSHKLVEVANKNGTPVPRRLLSKLGPAAQLPRHFLPAGARAASSTGISALVEAINKIPEAIVGLRQIREYQVGKQPMFHCTICDSQCDLSSIQTHLMGSKHRLKYLREYHPDVYEHVRTHGGKKSQLSAFLEEVCADVEEKEGRGVPMTESFTRDESKQEGGKPVAKEEKGGAKAEDADDKDDKDDVSKEPIQRLSHKEAVARYRELKRKKEREELADYFEPDPKGYPPPNPYYDRWREREPELGPREYRPSLDDRYRDDYARDYLDDRYRDPRLDPRYRDDPLYRDSLYRDYPPDPRLRDYHEDRSKMVISEEERYRRMFAYERHNFIYPEVGLTPAEEQRRMFMDYEQLGIPYEMARRRVLMQEDRLYRVSQYLRDGSPLDDARTRVLAEENRRQLMLAYERQGLTPTEARWRVIVEEERAKLFENYERRGINPLEARENIMAGKDRMALIHEYERRGMPPEEARIRAIEEEDRLRRHEERLRRGLRDEGSDSLDSTLTGIAEQRLLENYMRQGIPREEAKNKVIADLRRQGVPMQEAILRVERIIIRPDLTVEDDIAARALSQERVDRSGPREREVYGERLDYRERGTYREQYPKASSRYQESSSRADSRERALLRDRYMEASLRDEYTRVRTDYRHGRDSRDRALPRDQYMATDSRYQEASVRADFRDRALSREQASSRELGRPAPSEDRPHEKSADNIDSMSAEEAKERLLQEYMKRGVPREEARQSLISELIRQGVPSDEAKRRFSDAPKADQHQEGKRKRSGSHRCSQSSSPLSDDGRDRSHLGERKPRRESAGERRERVHYPPSGRERDPSGKERGPHGRERDVGRREAAGRHDPPRHDVKKEEENCWPTLTLGEELKRIKMKREGQEMASMVPEKQARQGEATLVKKEPPLATSQTAPASKPAQPEEPGPSTAPKNDVKDLLESLTNNLISSEDDAAMALQVSKALTSALLKYRLKSVPGDEYSSPKAESSSQSHDTVKKEMKAAPSSAGTGPALLPTPSRPPQPTDSGSRPQPDHAGQKGRVDNTPSLAAVISIPLPSQPEPQPLLSTPARPATKPSQPLWNVASVTSRAIPQSQPPLAAQPSGAPQGFRPRIYRAGQAPVTMPDTGSEDPGSVFDRPLGRTIAPQSKAPILPRVILTQNHGGASRNRGRSHPRGGFS